MAWFTNPTVIKGGIALAGGLYNAFGPDKQRDLQLEVLEDMKSQRRRVQRMARGQFTGAERQQIAAGAEPGLNRLSGNLAQRGLGTSGAGAQVMAQASVAPYAQAQHAAQMQLGQLNQNIFDAAGMLPSDDSFFDDLGAFAGLYEEFKGLQGLDAVDDDDGILNGGINWFLGIMQQAKDYQASLNAPASAPVSSPGSGGSFR